MPKIYEHCLPLPNWAIIEKGRIALVKRMMLLGLEPMPKGLILGGPALGASPGGWKADIYA